MRTLTIGASNLASARGFLDALDGFQAELVVTAEGTYQVRVDLDATDRNVLRVLNALEDHATARASGGVRLEVDGHSYLLDVDDARPPEAA